MRTTALHRSMVRITTFMLISKLSKMISSKEMSEFKKDNEDRAGWRARCRVKLAEHIGATDDKLHLSILPGKILIDGHRCPELSISSQSSSVSIVLELTTRFSIELAAQEK